MKHFFKITGLLLIVFYPFKEATQTVSKVWGTYTYDIKGSLIDYSIILDGKSFHKEYFVSQKNTGPMINKKNEFSFENVPTGIPIKLMIMCGENVTYQSTFKFERPSGIKGLRFGSIKEAGYMGDFRFGSTRCRVQKL
tara:strand:+ start:3205 stop:3618 length:414 start_codon:yes stop_codon:yes gene_type:complete